MSEYEEQRLKNIADNKEHLASLGLDTAGSSPLANEQLASLGLDTAGSNPPAKPRSKSYPIPQVRTAHKFNFWTCGHSTSSYPVVLR